MKDNHHLLIKLAVIFFCVLSVAFLTAKSIDRTGLDETYFMYATCDGMKINVFSSDGDYYLFLPAFAKEEELHYSYEALKHDIKVLKSDSLPAIFISTNSGSIDGILADKEYKEAGKMTVIGPDGFKHISVGLEYMKGRGNYSWNNWDKKPFKIKLNRSASILGLGEGEDFCLLANASDPTLIRNDLARRLEMAVGIPYASVGRFTDLYVNGDYMGNYYLCPSIEVGADRIDITDMDEVQDKVIKRLNRDAISVYETPTLRGWNLPESVDDITGGYLVEREFGDRYDLEYGSFNNGFVTTRGEHYIVLSPRYCTVSEINYIADFFQKAEDEIFGGGNFAEYIDTESFARRYLVEEVLKNYDGGVSSAYYYKDKDAVDGHIYAGPGWDFDMSLGNYLDWMEYASEDATGITKLYLSEHSSIVFKRLIGDDDFDRIVRDSFTTDVLPFFEEVLDTGLDKYEKELSASAAMDSIRWSDMYREKGYTTNDSAQYNNLKSFIEERLAFLRGEWSD